MPPSRKLRKVIVQTDAHKGLCYHETPDDIPGAAMVGWFKPRCLVAQSFVRTANVPELCVALRHELAHAARRDNLARVVVNLCRKLLFFFPPARWLCREWEKYVEFACDDAAVQTPQDALHLASALVKACRSSARVVPATALIGEWSTVEQRVRRLLVGNLKSELRTPNSELFLLLFAVVSFVVFAWTVAASFNLSLHCAVETLARFAL
jgi:beta-lactamase regulating signal transducer with metallopeptidase domain